MVWKPFQTGFNKLPKAGFSDNATAAFKIVMMVMRHKKLVHMLFVFKMLEQNPTAL